MNESDFRKSVRDAVRYASDQRMSVGDAADYIADNIMKSPGLEPAPNTVRVRIPVHWAGECHAVHWYGEDRHGPALDKLTESPIIAYITADIPLPQPVEVKGEVE